MYTGQPAPQPAPHMYSTRRLAALQRVQARQEAEREAREQQQRALLEQGRARREAKEAEREEKRLARNERARHRVARAPPRVALPPRYRLVLRRAILLNGPRGAIHAATPVFRPGVVPTEQDIKAVCDELARQYPGHQLQVRTYTAAHGWRPGRWFIAGQQPKLFNPDDYYDLQPGEEDLPYLQDLFVTNDHAHRITKFDVTVMPPPAGGASEHNDCLFDEIRTAYGGTRFPRYAPLTAEALKTALGLERDTPVSVEQIPAVERLYHTRITVVGDALYEGSTAGYQRHIRLSLLGGHFYGRDKCEPAVVKPVARQPVLYAFKPTPFFYGERYHAVTNDWLIQQLRRKPPGTVWKHAKPTTGVNAVPRSRCGSGRSSGPHCSRMVLTSSILPRVPRRHSCSWPGIHVWISSPFQWNNRHGSRTLCAGD